MQIIWFLAEGDKSMHLPKSGDLHHTQILSFVKLRFDIKST